MTDNIDWDAHLDGPDAPWRQDEDLFDCTKCNQERGELDDLVSRRWGRDVCLDCTRKITKATTWMRNPPTDDGWYWVRYPACGSIPCGSIFPAYVRHGDIFDDSRINRRLGIAVEVWPYGLEEPNESPLVTEAENRLELPEYRQRVEGAGWAKDLKPGLDPDTEARR